MSDQTTPALLTEALDSAAKERASGGCEGYGDDTCKNVGRFAEEYCNPCLIEALLLTSRSLAAEVAALREERDAVRSRAFLALDLDPDDTPTLGQLVAMMVADIDAALYRAKEAEAEVQRLTEALQTANAERDALRREQRADVERWNKANTEANAEIAALREERDALKRTITALQANVIRRIDARSEIMAENQRLTEALQTARAERDEAYRLWAPLRGALRTAGEEK